MLLLPSFRPKVSYPIPNETKGGDKKGKYRRENLYENKDKITWRIFKISSPSHTYLESTSTYKAKYTHFHKS